MTKTVNLYQGNCLEVLKTLPDNSVDLLLTDPPYVLNTKGSGTVNKKMKLSESLADVEKAKIINGYDIELFGQEFLRVMKEINAYFWCNKAQIYDYLKFYVGQLKCKLIVVIRDDLLDTLNVYSSNINKLITDSSIHIDWCEKTRHNQWDYDISKMILNKIRVSAKIDESISDKDIYMKFFSNKIENLYHMDYLISRSLCIMKLTITTK